MGPTPGYGSLLLLPVIWAALRSRPGELVLAIAGTAVVLFAPILVIGGTQYGASGWRTGGLFIVIAAVLGVTVLALVGRLSSGEERHRLLAEKSTDMLASQQALREIATLVATGRQPGAVFGAVAEQIARLLGGTLGGIVRFDGRSGIGEIVGGWSADGGDITGRTVDLAGTSAAAIVHRTGAPAQTAGYAHRADEPLVSQFGLGGAVCAPIFLGGRLWGSAGCAFASVKSIPPGAEERLARFADLIAVAIANAQAWETLTHRAATDPVTGLANHRTFHERLRSEVERASRHGRALSLAVFDLDHFKQINDTHGHQTGDDVLAAVAARLAAVARTGDLVARIGGEEFAWLMPETTQDAAYLAADRARRAVASTPFEVAGTITASGGVCSNEHARTAHGLLSAADQALYGAKRGGRNATFVYAQDLPPHGALTA